MKPKRRDLILLGAGAAAGTVLTPLPWKLADDVSIWSQNWSWIPRPARGEIKTKYTACTLCPGGPCGVRAKCVGVQPVALSPVGGHPISRGALCARAFGAHQLPYHPARVKTPLRRGSPANMESVVADVAAALKRGGAIAVLDEVPGRSASVVYAKFAETVGGTYIAHRPPQAATVDRVAAMARIAPDAVGLDLEGTRTAISFGAPLLETCIGPGRMQRLWKDGRLDIVQVDSELSRTAALAQRFIRTVPGSESDVAANLMTEAMAGPAVALSRGGFGEDAELAIARLNVALHSRTFVQRAALPFAEDLHSQQMASVPDGSLSVLIIDHGQLGGWLSWRSIKRKLAPNAVVVSITPYLAGVATHATFVVPAPAWLESTTDAGTPWHEAVASYSIAPALLPGMQPVTLLHALASLPAEDDVRRSRIAALHKTGRGNVFLFATNESRLLSSFETPEKLEQAFNAGACWTDTQVPRPIELTGSESASQPRSDEFTLPAILPRPAVAPPLACKLERESNLFRQSARVYMNPLDAQRAGLTPGQRVRVEGSPEPLRVSFDKNVAPGTAAVLDSEMSEWRADARLVRT